MKEKIFSLLDELVSMSMSTYTTESLGLEIEKNNKNKQLLQEKINKLENNMIDSNYFDISSQMADKNTEINLKKRIQKLSESEEQIKENIENELANENETHDEIKYVLKKISNSKLLLEAFKSKKSNAMNKEINKTYSSLYDNELNKLNELERELNKIKAKNAEISNNLELLSTAKQDLQEKIQYENNRLQDIKNLLNNEKNYFDYDAKKADAKNLKSLKNELEETEKLNLTFLMDPANLANEVKNLIVSDDWKNSILKLKELISVIENIPYLKENNKDIIIEKKEKILELIKSKKKEIDSKQYSTEEKNVIESRIGYLVQLNDELNNKRKILKEMCSSFDNKTIAELKSEIDKNEQSKIELKTTLKSLENNKENSDSMELLATIMCYKKELLSVEKIISNQNDDMLFFVDFSSILEKTIFKKLDNLINSNNKEIRDLEKELNLKSRIKDIEEKSADENKLHELEKELYYLENRLKYEKTPDEIYNDIDCLIGSLDFDEPIKYTKSEKESFKSNYIKPSKDDIKVIKKISVNSENIIDEETSDMGYNEIVNYIGGN